MYFAGQYRYYKDYMMDIEQAPSVPTKDIILQFLPSNYNFAVPVDKGYLLYNALSGAVLEIGGHDAHEIIESLCGSQHMILSSSIAPATLAHLMKGGFLIEPEFNEMRVIKERYYKARNYTPAVLTITTTMDCNLGCYYCYESRTEQKLKIHDIPSILHIIDELFKTNPHKSLHVDWYGGEPLMNLDFFEQASLKIQNYCLINNIFYNSSIISNGTCWPDDIENFIRVHKINQVQISFDGLKQNHEKRRRYRKGYNESNHSSFNQAVSLVDKLVNCVRVDLRFNIDRKNSVDLMPFINFAVARGWFNAPYPAIFQPARLASYSERSNFMRNYELSIDEFDKIRDGIRSKLADVAKIEESEAPDGFPYPRTSVCAALANHSIVLGAEGGLYRCGLQVGEFKRAVHHIKLTEANFPSQNASQEAWWAHYDPTENPRCKHCSFLPICWGGCPKKHLEGDKHAIFEQGRYWRKNLPRLISQKLNKKIDPEFVYSQEDQFRYPVDIELDE